jgi:hypothetical protein
MEPMSDTPDRPGTRQIRHLGSFLGAEDLVGSPTWGSMVALAAEGLACEIDAEARWARQHVPAVFGANPCLPPPHLLKAIRAHAHQAAHRTLSLDAMLRLAGKVARKKVR